MMSYVFTLIFKKLSYRLYNYQKQNPIECQDLNIRIGNAKIKDTDPGTFYIDLMYGIYEIHILNYYDTLTIQIIDPTSRNNLFDMVPPMTINQEEIRFNSSRYMFKMNQDLIKLFKTVFKMQFHNKQHYPYFTTKNDILSQT